MDLAFSRELEVEMHDIENMFKKSLQPWWEDLADLLTHLQGDRSFQLMPAVVILAYKYLDMDHEIRVAMGNLFKTIYFANRIHTLVKDSDEGQIHNQDMQFTILIGDYIFGRVLKLLLEAKADKVLDEFAQMISQINEGLVIMHKSDVCIQEVMLQTSAPFYSTAFLTAARLKGLDGDEVALYEELGLNLGMALELTLIGHSMEALNYLNETFESINKIKLITGNIDSSLDKLLKELQDMVPIYDSAAVV